MTTINTFIKHLAQKKIVILGLGKEGLSTYQFLRKNLPEKQIWLIDEKSVANLSQNWQKINKSDNQATFSTHFEHLDLQQAPTINNKSGIIVFKTPGIAPNNKLVQQAQKLNSEFSSNTDLFFALIKIANEELSKQNLPNNKLEQTRHIATIGVTGTKGKSTTTALIDHILKSAGLHSFLGGNIGVAPLSLWEDILDTAKNNLTNQPVFATLELSCHQLNNATFSPNYSVILDITPEHLDYYKDFSSYVKAKSQICRFQTSNDFAIYNSEQYLPKKIAHLADTQHLTFSFTKNIVNNWIVYSEKIKESNSPKTDNPLQKIVNLASLNLVGKHNITNALPSVIIAKQLGISNEKIAEALKTFEGLPHRLELVEEISGISYYNDSLSTTPVATIAAIESFKNNPIILIAGGFDRGLDYSALAETIVEHQVKHLVLLPDTGNTILEEVKKRLHNNMGELKITQVTSMKEAVEIAKKSAIAGDIVLMSPASASFNLFKDYADRGNQFKKFVTLS